MFLEYGIDSPKKKIVKKLDQSQASAVEFRRSMSEGLLKRAGQQATEAWGWISLGKSGKNLGRFTENSGFLMKFNEACIHIESNLEVMTRNEVVKQV
jgi:hypothetical protein